MVIFSLRVKSSTEVNEGTSTIKKRNQTINQTINEEQSSSTRLTERILVARVVFKDSPIDDVTQLLVHIYRHLVTDSDKQVDEVGPFPANSECLMKLLQ